MYQHIARKLAAGHTIILDGGTGTEIERRGVPMSGEVWCADANLSHPHAVQSVHADYFRAGADVIIANTFATSPLLFDHHGRVDEIAKIDGIAVDLARAAVARSERPVAVAASFSIMRPAIKGTDDSQLHLQWPEKRARELMRIKAEAIAAARADFIVMEMMRDLDYSLMATEAAVATGLPVWVGFAAERREDGKLSGFGRHDFLFEDLIAPIMALGAKAACVMHTSSADTAEALRLVRRHWSGPLGAYPESGYFKMPSWQFVDVISADDLVAHAKAWRAQGVTLFGGCCGIGPGHIAALAQALKERTA